MPFDGNDTSPDINRRRLIDALRHELPPTFEWNFTTIATPADCGTAGCALGLAQIMWPHLEKAIAEDDDAAVAAFFGLPKEMVDEIFYGSDIYKCGMYEVTPGMVADAIEALAE
jgi:hypothetical protein